MSKASETHPRPVSFIGADGQEYIVKPLTLNSLIAIEEKYGLESIEDAFDVKALELGRLSNLRWVLWLVLQQAHPELDEKKVGEIINISNMKQANAAVVWAFTAGMPGGEDQLPGNDEEGSQQDPTEAFAREN